MNQKSQVGILWNKRIVAIQPDAGAMPLARRFTATNGMLHVLEIEGHGLVWTRDEFMALVDDPRYKGRVRARFDAQPDLITAVERMMPSWEVFFQAWSDKEFSPKNILYFHNPGFPDVDRYNQSSPLFMSLVAGDFDKYIKSLPDSEQRWDMEEEAVVRLYTLHGYRKAMLCRNKRRGFELISNR